MNSSTDRREPAAKPGSDRTQETKHHLAQSGNQAKEELARASTEVRKQGEEIASAAMEKADQYANEQKEAGAQHVASFARAVDRAADELEQSSPELASYARRAASSVDSFSDTLRQRSVRGLIDDTNEFARREPALFFGAAVVAGMAISRFLRSSEDVGTSAQHTGAGSGAGASRTTPTGRPS